MTGSPPASVVVDQGRAAPFIVTATLPPDLFAWADALRRAHYPPERNLLPAHVTLFHGLAPSLGSELRGLLARLAADQPPPAAQITGLLDLGQGTAIALTSPALLALRDEIAEHFHGALTVQDQHRPRLHITVQNKVTPAEARALRTRLAETLMERAFAFPGLALHIYRGGPWEAAGSWGFRGRAWGKRGG